MSIATNPFRDDAPRHAEGLMLPLAAPTSATPPLLAAALAGLARLHRPGLFYHKTGVVLTGLLATATLARQPTLFPEPPPDPTPNRPAIDPARANRLTAALDQINQRFTPCATPSAAYSVPGPCASASSPPSPPPTGSASPEGRAVQAVSRRARSAIEAVLREAGD